MQKEERSGNGPGLQGPFREPMMSDLDIEEAGSVPASELSHSPVAMDKRSLAQFREEALQCLLSPKKPWVLLFHSNLAPVVVSLNPLSLGLRQLLKPGFGHLGRTGL